MKVVKALLIIAALFTGVACGNADESEEPAEESVEIAAVEPNATITLDVKGMTCEVGCKGAIEKHMSKTAGVARCNIDFEKAVAVIEYDNNTITEDQIIAEIGTLANHAYSASRHADEAEGELQDLEVLESIEQ